MIFIKIRNICGWHCYIVNNIEPCIARAGHPLDTRATSLYTCVKVL